MGKEKKDLEFDGEIALFEEKPFSGFCFENVDPLGEQHHADLAITEMFGGLPEEFYSSYMVRSTLDVFGSEGYYKNGKKMVFGHIGIQRDRSHLKHITKMG